MNTRRIVWIAVLILIVLIVGFLGYLLFLRPASQVTPSYSTAKVTRGTIDSKLSVTGTIISANQVDLNFDNPGKLLSLNVGVNQAVTSGQALATLDPTAANLPEQTLTSPIDGTVIQIAGKVGEQIGTTTTTAAGAATSATGTAGASAIATPGFITVADLNNLQVKIGVDQADISKVSVNQAATINLDAIPDKEFSGTVVFINPIPTNNQNVITYTVYASLASPDPRVRLGMSANVGLKLGKKKDVLLVPNLAVKTVEGKKVVTKIVGGRPVDSTVEVGISDDKNTEITKGLSEGNTVAVGVISLTQTTGQGGEFFGR